MGRCPTRTASQRAMRSAIAGLSGSTAAAKASALAAEGAFIPLTFRTYCSAAAFTSAAVAGGSKL